MSRLNVYSKICASCTRLRDSEYFAPRPYYRGFCRECCSVRTANKRAKKIGRIGQISLLEWVGLKSLFNFQCTRCGISEKESLENLYVALVPDHIIPLSQENSTNIISNIQPLCSKCNNSKGNKSSDFRLMFIRQLSLVELRSETVKRATSLILEEPKILYKIKHGTDDSKKNLTSKIVELEKQVKKYEKIIQDLTNPKVECILYEKVCTGGRSRKKVNTGKIKTIISKYKQFYGWRKLVEFYNVGLSNDERVSMSLFRRHGLRISRQLRKEPKR